MVAVRFAATVLVHHGSLTIDSTYHILFVFVTIWHNWGWRFQTDKSKNTIIGSLPLALFELLLTGLFPYNNIC
jgi:hypothetical protein